MSNVSPHEIRQEALRFLYERKALPHQLSAVHAGLRRAGHAVDRQDTVEALDYLTSAGFTERKPGPMGGGQDAASWKITAAGCNQHEEIS